jgi:hypothetical protein
MKKLIFMTFVLVLVLLIGGTGVAYMYRTQLLSSILSKTLEVPSSIQEINFSSSGATIKELHIQNPKGCTLKDALLVKTIDIKLAWKDAIKTTLGFGSKKIIIRSIAIDSPQMAVEIFNLTGSDTNWSRILNTGTTSSEPSSIDLQIDTLLLTNIQLQAKYHILGKADFNPAPVAKIEIHNIGSDSDVTTKQLIFIVFKVLMSQAASQLNLKTLVPEMLLQKVIPLPLFEIQEARKLIDNFFQKKQSPNNDNNNQ